MRKFSVITLMLIVGYSCSTNQSSTNQSSAYPNPKNQKKTGWDELNLKGKVKSLEETVYRTEEKFGELQKGHKEDFKSYLFDSNGRLLEQGVLENYNFSHNGGAVVKYTFNYDDKGNKIKSTYHALIELTRPVVDSDGGITGEKETYYNQDSIGRSTRIKSTYKYDDKGNLLEENNYNYIEPMYGSADTVTKCELQTKYIYKYDANGYKIQSNEYSGSGSLVQSIKFNYDEVGNLIEKKYIHVIDTTNFNQTLYKYDNKNNLIEEDRNEFDFKDSKGKVRLKPKNVANYKYEFDNQGNWIKMTSVDGWTYITERTIIYY